MRICIDLDGVVAELRKPGETYADVGAVAGAAEKLRELREAGHYIILFTARHMKTSDGNVGRVIARQGLVTLRWLEDHDIQYDELHFGKPHADLYLDDNAMRFQSWDEIAGDGSSFPMSHEQMHEGMPESDPDALPDPAP